MSSALVLTNNFHGQIGASICMYCGTSNHVIVFNICKECGIMYLYYHISTVNCRIYS